MIEALLAKVNQPGSKNNFTADQVRESVRQWLEMVAEENEQFPEEADAAVWNLDAKDFGVEPDQDMFVAYVFDQTTVTFAAGRAPPDKAIIRFCENEFEGEAVELVEALKARFSPVEVFACPRADVDRWLAT